MANENDKDLGINEAEVKKKLKKVQFLPLFDLLGMESETRDKRTEIFPLYLPLYVITTRDSFAYDLIEKITIVNMNGRKVKKTGKNKRGESRR